MNCPSCLSPNTETILEINATEIKSGYLEMFQISVDESLPYEQVKLWRCNECGLQFYNQACPGGSGFYEQLQQFDWYYMPWKWEHEQAEKLIPLESALLEVGCGSGGFLDKLKKIRPDIRSEGLELNDKALEECQKKGLKVKGSRIEKYCEDNTNYDVVCSFQVLEHIEEAKSFLEANVKCLKSGGLLLISVPNNASFIRRDNFNLLNMPPHHMILWNQSSLEFLSRLYPLKLEKLYYEPLQDYHIDWYINLLLQRMTPPIPSLVYRMHLKSFLTMIIRSMAPIIKGHSIMGAYRKM